MRAPLLALALLLLTPLLAGCAAPAEGARVEPAAEGALDAGVREPARMVDRTASGVLVAHTCVDDAGMELPREAYVRVPSGATEFQASWSHTAAVGFVEVGFQLDGGPVQWAPSEGGAASWPIAPGEHEEDAPRWTFLVRYGNPMQDTLCAAGGHAGPSSLTIDAVTKA